MRSSISQHDGAAVLERLVDRLNCSSEKLLCAEYWSTGCSRAVSSGGPAMDCQCVRFQTLIQPPANVSLIWAITSKPDAGPTSAFKSLIILRVGTSAACEYPGDTVTA